jgi:prophage regulatory protein
MFLIRITEVKRELGYRSDTSVHNDVKNLLLPPPVAIGQRSKAWVDYEVQAVVASRIAGKSNDEISALVRALIAKRPECYADVCDRLGMPGRIGQQFQEAMLTSISPNADSEICVLNSVTRAQRGELIKVKA